MGPQILKSFYSCTIESILTGCITAWYGNCSASDRKALQRVVGMAQYITGAKLPAIQGLYIRRCQRKAHKIVRDSSHSFLCYRTASGTVAPSLGPKGSSTASTPSHQTAEQFIKIATGQFTLTPPLLYTAATHCLFVTYA